MLIESMADHAATLAAITGARRGMFSIEELGYQKPEEFEKDILMETGGKPSHFGRVQALHEDGMEVVMTYMTPPMAARPAVSWLMI